MHFCRRYGLWHKHHFLTENACFLRLDEGMTLQKTQLYCSGKVTTDQFWVPWYHRRSQGTNISILYHAPNYAPSIYDTTVRQLQFIEIALDLGICLNWMLNNWNLECLWCKEMFAMQYSRYLQRFFIEMIINVLGFSCWEFTSGNLTPVC